jgi:hypothetical protein
MIFADICARLVVRWRLSAFVSVGVCDPLGILMTAVSTGYLHVVFTLSGIVEQHNFRGFIFVNECK